MVPKENKNNSYAKFGGTNKEYYGIFPKRPIDNTCLTERVTLCKWGYYIVLKFIFYGWGVSVNDQFNFNIRLTTNSILIFNLILNSIGVL